MKVNFYVSALALAILLWTANAFSQAVRPEKVVKSIGFDISKKLSDVKYKSTGYVDQTWKDKLIPNKEGFLEEFNKEATWKGADPVLQGNQLKSSSASANIVKNFSGQGNLSGVAPPDIVGDVSPLYYMQMVNLSLQIWDKNGVSKLGPVASSTLWDGFTGAWTGTNDGDPIVLYDQVADRWIATQFSLPNYPSGPFYELVAVSTTNNPLGTWYRYAFEFVNMPDYPKFGIWRDGYYLTVNQFASRTGRFKGAGVAVLDRAAMISGSSSAQMLFFNLGTSYGSLLPADADGTTPPPAGSPNYLADLGTNSLHIWQASVDWTNTANSSVTLVNTLTTQPYSYSGITISQPGTSQTLDALASRLMYRLQYRNFGTYQVMLTNHSVNANGTGQAGVRWYELRNYGSGWSIYQQGTYAPADGNSRWMGSVAMNGNGDIGVGYSVSGSSTYPSIRFAGQSKASSGSGLLDVAETTIKAGAFSQTGVNRWGDYSMMSVDPTDDVTFWYTNEYSNGGWDWQTQIASFNFGTPVVIAPVADFSGSPTSVAAGQTVTFTDLSINNPTSWIWSFPGGTPSTSTQKNPVITYSTTGTYNVSLTATNTAGSNTKTKSGYITVTASGAIPVAAFTGSPTTLDAGGSVQFTDQSTNTPTSWNWTFTGGNPATSTAQNPSVTYSTAGTYAVALTAANTFGSNTLTKSGYITVNTVGTGTYCSSGSTSNALDYIIKVAISSFSNTSTASLYSDFTGKIIGLIPGSSNSVALTPHSTSQRDYWRIWIDFNADGDFDDSGELVFSANNKKNTATGSISIPSTASGQTRMRISMGVGVVPATCGIFPNGEVEDYTVNFGNAPAIMSKQGKLTLEIYPNPASESLNLSVTGAAENVNVKVYNALGQIVNNFNIKNNQTTINISKYQKGIYFVGVDDGNQNALKKFIKE